MKKWIGGTVLGFVLGVVITFALMRHGNVVMYDATILAHVNEAILNAVQIRRGEDNEVLTRTDAWLRGEQIEMSIDGYMTSADGKSKALQAINEYRSKYEPVESPNQSIQPTANNRDG